MASVGGVNAVSAQTTQDQEQSQASANSSGSREDSTASKTSSPSSSSTVCHSSSTNHGKQNRFKSNQLHPNTKSSKSSLNTEIPEAVTVEEFDEEDVARYESHKTEEDIAKCRRTQDKIRALRGKQQELKEELEAAKGRLMIDKSRWSLECKITTFSDRFCLKII